MLVWVGALLGVCGLGVVAAVLAGFAAPTFLGALPPIAIALLVVVILSRTFGSLAKKARELPARGIRRKGRVRDAMPYGSPHGGAVFQPEGAQMVLRVELDSGGGASDTVTVHVVEDSERARARIGTEVTILEHPDDPALRALEGFLPNGRPRSARENGNTP